MIYKSFNPITTISTFIHLILDELHPIPKINFQNKTEKAAHDKIVSFVDQMLEAKKQLQTAKTDKDKTYYERRCETLDRQIDQLVYELYGLTEEEIRIIENKS